jgi:Outer membrane protein beta-barrel domain
MWRTIWLLGLALSIPGFAEAQSHEQPAVEIFGGASVLRNGATAPSFSLYSGWQAEGSVNFNKYLGFTADFGGQYRSISGNRVSQYEYLFGPRVAARSHSGTVFVHALAGGNTLKAFGRSTNGFAWGLGGGLDLNAGRHIAIRVIQADYLRTRVSNTWFNDARLGVGIVFKFGE